MSTLIQPMSPLSLDQWTRDLWETYDAAAIAQVAPLADLDCYAQKFYKAPAAADEYMQAFANAKFGLEITFGSLIFGIYALLPAGWIVSGTEDQPFYNLQVTDESLNHQFWDAPIPMQFMSNAKPSYQSTTFAEVGTFPNLLPCPYPVVGNGVFLIELWETSGSAQRIELIFGVLERVKALSIEGV